MAGQWKRQAERAEERQALDELAHADPRGRVRLICGRCGDWEPSDTERTIDAHYAAAHGREEARLGAMTPERLTEIEQLVAGGIVYLKPATAKDLIAHIRDLEAQLAACDIGWISWLSEGNRKAFLQGLGDWKATAERDEFLRHQPSPEVDYRREGEHGRSLPNNWPSPEVGGMKSGLTTLDLHLLDKACIPVWAAFQNTYLVGTAQTGGEYRDVDVRTILKDEEFDRLFGGESQRQLWELICVAVGHLLSQQTGLPIDYQIQRMSEANAKYDGPRNPIGRKRQYAAWGDATPWALQPPSPEVGE